MPLNDSAPFCALIGMKATTGSASKPMKSFGATPITVYFAGPMSSFVPITDWRPPNCVCQKA